MFWLVLLIRWSLKKWFKFYLFLNFRNFLLFNRFISRFILSWRLRRWCLFLWKEIWNLLSMSWLLMRYSSIFSHIRIVSLLIIKMASLLMLSILLRLSTSNCFFLFYFLLFLSCFLIFNIQNEWKRLWWFLSFFRFNDFLNFFLFFLNWLLNEFWLNRFWYFNFNLLFLFLFNRYHRFLFNLCNYFSNWFWFI